MSENDIILNDLENIHEKKYFNIRYKISIDENSYEQIMSDKSSINIIIKDKDSCINLNILSAKRIFYLCQLEYKDYINMYLDKDDLNIKSDEPSLNESLTVSTNRRTEKEINEETTDDDGEESTIKEYENFNKEGNNNDIHLPVKKRFDNIFDPNSPLLNNKITNKFSNIETTPTKYLSLIICGNKTIINLDYLKCMYPTLICCGIFNLLYFISIVFNTNINIDNLYHYILYIPLSLLLITTGIYGYKNAKKNIYNDELCIILTNLCIITPIFNLVLSRIYQEAYEKGHYIINFMINFISCFIAFCSVIILKEFERVQKSEKDFIQN